MDIAQEHVTLVHHYSMWVGTNSELARILAIFEQEARELLPEYVASETKTAQRDLERHDALIDRLTTEIEAKGTGPTATDDEYVKSLHVRRAEATQRLEERRSEAANAPLMSLAIEEKSGRRVFRGDAESCSAYLVGRRYESVTIDAPAFGSRSFELNLTAEDSTGLYLRVFSRDDKQATAVMSYLQREANRGQPSWRVVREWFFLFPFFIVMFNFVLYNVGDLIAKLTTETGKFPDEFQWPVSILVSGLAMALAAITTFGLRRVLPAFEVVADNDRPRGKRIFGWLVGAVGTVVLSVGANLLTGVIQAG